MHLMDYDEFDIYNNFNDINEIRTLAINKIMAGETEQKIIESIEFIYGIAKDEIDKILNEEI